MSRAGELPACLLAWIPLPVPQVVLGLVHCTAPTFLPLHIYGGNFSNASVV